MNRKIGITLSNFTTLCWVTWFKASFEVSQNPNPGWQPLIGLRFSDDGGQTWSNDKVAYAGHTGQYGWRVIWRQLGSGRDRVFEVYGQDPIPVALVEFYVRISPGDA